MTWFGSWLVPPQKSATHDFAHQPVKNIPHLLAFSFGVCMCVHMVVCAHVCMGTCLHACGGQKLSLSSSALYVGTGSLIESRVYQLVKHSWLTRSRGFPVSFSLELGLQMFATIPRCLCGFWELTFNLLKGCSLSTEELCYLFWLALFPDICMPTLLTPIDIDSNVMFSARPILITSFKMISWAWWTFSDRAFT